METSFEDKIKRLFELLSYTCGLSEAVSELYKIDNSNKIICLQSNCNHISSFQDEDEAVKDLEELAKEHAMFAHGDEILKGHLKSNETLLDSETSIVKQYLSENITLKEFVDVMLKNSKIIL